ncbi:hypothetical protein JCM11641_007592 [Rhodosporidiobolus odoratus]
MTSSSVVQSITTEHGDQAWLSYESMNPAEIEVSCRDEKDGAVVSFVGYTRNEFQGRTVTHLTYESYIPLALKTLHQVLLDARSLPPPAPLSYATHDCASHSTSSPSSKIEVSRIKVAHLLGPSPPLTPSIVICVASPHRREAFFLAEWLLEEVKKRVQVWKREWYADEPAAAAVTAEVEKGEKDDGEKGGLGAPSFVGRDGEGLDGVGGRARDKGIARERKAGESKWKENFPPQSKGGA